MLCGIGYEGQSITTFIDRLVADRITDVVDVRMTPISRKPGFSKAALSRALADVGMAYHHRPELGNPKANRAGFTGSEAEVAHARQVYADAITNEDAQSALDEVADLARHGRVAVLCFEADQERCHRDVVLADAERRQGRRSAKG